MITQFENTRMLNYLNMSSVSISLWLLPLGYLKAQVFKCEAYIYPRVITSSGIPEGSRLSIWAVYLTSCDYFLWDTWRLKSLNFSRISILVWLLPLGYLTVQVFKCEPNTYPRVITSSGDTWNLKSSKFMFFGDTRRLKIVNKDKKSHHL